MGGKRRGCGVLAAKRWKKTTKAERQEVGQNMNAAQWVNATPEEPAAHGRILAETRGKAVARRKAAKNPNFIFACTSVRIYNRTPTLLEPSDFG